VVVISLTGSLLVFRVEYYNYFRPGTTVPVRSTERLNDDALKAAAERQYPALKVTSVQQRRRQRTAPAEVYLEGDGTTLHRSSIRTPARTSAMRSRARRRFSNRSPRSMTIYSADAPGEPSTVSAV
jgi:uncharacterized iron-regulated membrane protein